MAESIKSFVSDLLNRQKSPQLPGELMVYGGGGNGRRIAKTLRDLGMQIPAILDRKALPGDSWEGLPISTPTGWLRSNTGSCRAVVIAIHNPGHLLNGLVAELEAAGFGPIFSLVDLCDCYPQLFEGLFWLAPRSLYRENLERLEELDDRLDDAFSRETLRNILEFRITGNYSVLNPPVGSQYVPTDLPRWKNPLRLMDCGAYDGDTVVAMQAAGYEIDEVICFEPDPENFRKLANNVAHQKINATCLPCAVAFGAMQLRFSAEGVGSSHVHANGNMVVQTVGIDESFQAFRPNLIKMDIEGGEIDALRGARETIGRYRPGLAISIYHRAEHLWQIPALVAELMPDSSLAIRPHAHNSFDLALYANPFGGEFSRGVG